VSEVVVLAYFPDDATRVYQLAQWLRVLEVLDDAHGVAVVARDPGAAAACGDLTRLPVLLAESFSDLTLLYGELGAKLVLYCNNSSRNFESLIDARMLHVHIGHGESDKQSMASNNAKAYDRVFVAGQAAVQRHQTGLLDFDSTRLVRIGRPPLDLQPLPLLAPSSRRTVLYAPTWEGDAEYNDYSSVDVSGPGIVRAILALPDVRLVYKPHPKVTTSSSAAMRDGHHAIMTMLAEANSREPEAGHTAITVGDILAVMPQCDVIVTDVSSVGLDWLYLHTEKPIVLFDRHHDPEGLRRDVPVSRCADVVDGSNLGDLTELLASRLRHDEHHLARIAMRRHYFDDLQIGDSTVFFLQAVSDLIALRDELIGAGARPEDVSETATG
jgi:hypothetical protein